MKCLTIKQPYVELILCGKKKIEIRSWPTKLRGKVLIHAGKDPNKEIVDKYVNILDKQNIKFGYILGMVEIVECIKIDKGFIERYNKENANTGYYIDNTCIDKYAFVLKNPKRIKPIKIGGKLSFWNYTYKEEK